MMKESVDDGELVDAGELAIDDGSVDDGRVVT